MEGCDTQQDWNNFVCLFVCVRVCVCVITFVVCECEQTDKERE